MTTFEKVSKLNLAFGNPKGDINNPDWDRIRAQAKLVLEEAQEVYDAALDENMQELMDGQGDVTTVNDGVAHIAGFDGNDCYDCVERSNMSKFITTEQESEATLDKYYAEGWPVGSLYIEGDLPLARIKVAYDITVDNKEIPKGKFLKCVSFKEPDFSPLLK